MSADTRLVVDCTTGETEEIELTTEEIAQRAVDVAAATAERVDEEQRVALLTATRPGQVILTKLRNGTDLTAAEMQRVVRYLALRVVREATG